MDADVSYNSPFQLHQCDTEFADKAGVSMEFLDAGFVNEITEEHLNEIRRLKMLLSKIWDKQTYRQKEKDRDIGKENDRQTDRQTGKN